MRVTFLSRLLVLLLCLAGCNAKTPAPPPAAAPGAKGTAAVTGVTKGSGEYTNMPGAVDRAAPLTAEEFAAEVRRGGPSGEPRIFENAQELADLMRGSPTTFMNAQFRYYLVGVTLQRPQGECKTPLLAINLVVENLHGTPASAIRGEFRFSHVTTSDATATADASAVAYQADIIGPFSNKHGGFAYATAYVEARDASVDIDRWATIASTQPQRLKVWFKPDTFYYADGRQYARTSGWSPAQREVVTCGGAEGARAIIR